MFDWILKDRADPRSQTDTDTIWMDGLLITGQNGLVAGTHVASNLGWRAVEALSVGDKVLTFDNGMQRITDIQRETMWMPGQPLPLDGCPVFVPDGALFNRRDLWIMPEQGLLIEADAVCDALGDPYAVVSAGMLDGFRGIHRKPPQGRLDKTLLSFDADQVVYAEGGLLAHCPRPRLILMDDRADGAIPYNVLGTAEAQALVRRLLQQDDTRAFSYDPEEVACVA